jgi:hypothetical protein
MDHDENPAHSPEDSITAGREIAKKLGLFEENQAIRIASLGTDDTGTEQLLLIDNQTLRVSTLEGSELLEVHRDSIVTIEVENIDPEPNQRLLLTVRNGVLGMAEEWAHRTDHNGRYLKDTLIKMTPLPPTGSHNQAIPRSDWRYDEIALMVGKIVMRAAEAENTLSIVAARADGFEPKAFGQTGEQLTKHLKRLGETSPAIKDLAERYEAWTPLRNQLVHSTRPMDRQGRPGMETMKQNRLKQGAIENLSKGDFYTVEKQDQSALVDMYYAYNSLRHDALDAYMELIQGVSVENLTVPKSVPKEQRLPSGRGTGCAGHF